MIKIENAIANDKLKLLESNLTSNLTAWTYNHNVAYGEGKMQYGFSTNVFEDNKVENPSLAVLLNPVKALLGDIDLIRCRVGFIFYSGQQQDEYHDPHVDFEFEHKTSLFYVNNSDAPTVFYNEKYPSKDNKFTVKDVVYPKANTLITFDGLEYHSSSSPRNPGHRLVVTFNYRGE